MGDAPEAASFSSLIYYLNLDKSQLSDDIASKKINPILDRLVDNFFTSINMKLMKAVLEALGDGETLKKLNLIANARSPPP
jgi:hypothetical protein